jgi:hypothetical protein
MRWLAGTGSGNWEVAGRRRSGKGSVGKAALPEAMGRGG